MSTGIITPESKYIIYQFYLPVDVEDQDLTSNLVMQQWLDSDSGKHVSKFSTNVEKLTDYDIGSNQYRYQVRMTVTGEALTMWLLTR